MYNYQKDFSKIAGENIKKNSVRKKNANDIEMFPANGAKRKVSGVKYSENKNKDFNYEKEALKLLAVGIAGVLALNGLIQYFKFLGERDEKLLENAGEIIGGYNSTYEPTEVSPSPEIEIIEGGKTY